MTCTMRPICLYSSQGRYKYPEFDNLDIDVHYFHKIFIDQLKGSLLTKVLHISSVVLNASLSLCLLELSEKVLVGTLIKEKALI